MTFSDPAGLNQSSLAANAVRVFTPEGVSLPVTFVTGTNVSATEDIATFEVPAPTETGDYEIDLVNGQVSDPLGNVDLGRNLGTFAVIAPVSSPTPTPTSTSTGLVASIGSSFPTSVIGAATGVISVDLSAESSPIGGPVTIILFASLTTTFDSNAVALGRAVTKPVKIKPEGSVPLRLRYDFPPTLRQGSYYVLAEITRAGATSTVASASPINVFPAFVDLAAAFPQHLATPLAPGGKGSVLITVVNDGNTLARGTIRIALSAVASGGPSTAVGTAVSRVNLKPGKAKTFRIRYRLPLTLAAGSYQFSGTLQAVAGFTDSNQANNTALDPTSFTLE